VLRLTLEEKAVHTTFDPNAAAADDSGIFGLPYTVAEAKLVLIPVPWEATTSYGGGTSQGPQAILAASKQVDLFDFELGNFYEAGIAMLDEAPEILDLSAAVPEASQEEINTYSEKVNHWVYTETQTLLAQGKLVGLVGGDHSTPFGAIQAFLEKYPNLGILHFDAHADLRKAYEGYEHSHASIMYNVVTKTPLKKLVQVGIRDFCEEEFNLIQESNGKIVTFFDAALFEQKADGKSWSLLCDEIIKNLPQEVYVSFDIDGLDPRFCPHTGTPVPGGLDFQEAIYLLKKLVQSGRSLVGFDLNEVSPGVSLTEGQNAEVVDSASEWDANVGARLLYKLCGYTLHSKKGK
jgi:agmatinase